MEGLNSINNINKEMDMYFSKIVQEVNPLDYFSKWVVPELEGCEDVKKALLLMLVSDDPHETKTARKRIHIGLVGVPGTGKTVIGEAIERDFFAKYLTQDTSKASLKGDARKKDFGIQIFKKYHGGIIIFDEIELFQDRETLRDVMENGWVQINKAGMEEKYPARVRIIAGSNKFDNLSPALQDRLDFIFHFDIPTPEESKRIARKVVAIYAGRMFKEEIAKLKEYLNWIGNFSPAITEEEEHRINELFDSYFDLTGEGRTGRWISKVMRVAFAHAKLRKDDVKVRDVKVALKMLSNNKKKEEEK